MKKRKLLTKDQLRLLKYDNSPSNKYKTNLDLQFELKIKIFFKEILNIHTCGKQAENFLKQK